MGRPSKERPGGAPSGKAVPCIWSELVEMAGTKMAKLTKTAEG